MKNRVLLKEIPSSKFHSAIFTTYSINLYYFEQQVLPLFGSKGIHYVSVLVDSNMLNNQLDAYSQLSETRKRNYALHGIQCNGAFHPKIILLAGETTLLLLIGSGNLTSSGHGKNLEVWNAIYVENKSDEKLGFVLQAWNYLKGLHIDLGKSAINKLKSIEENCTLLSDGDKANLSDSYSVDNHTKISFLSSQKNNSLYSQLSKVVDNEKIDRITIMSPYYDVEGKFIELLNKRFKPSTINVILQEEFGAVPNKMKPSANVNFYNWFDIKNENVRQEYFHAKNIVFEGKHMKYLVSGSANASIAAFGSEQIPNVNQETCVLYQNKDKNYLELLGINLKNKKSALSDFQQIPISNENQKNNKQYSVFIKTLEKSYDLVTIYFTSQKVCPGSTLSLIDSKGQVQYTKELNIEKGDSEIQLSIPNGLSLICGVFSNKESTISNKQFVIDINAFESTNPSPKNRSLNQIRKIIETGNFSTQKIIEYLNTIYKQKEIKKITATGSAKSEEEKKNEIIIEEESELLYLSYNEIQEKTRNLGEIKNAKGYIEYKSVRLWESIFSYLKESKLREEQAKIDEEETEDINKSTGRTELDKQKSRKPISKSNHQRVKDKIEKFLENYWEILETKINNKNAEQPSLIDLSMFLIVLEILLHLTSHKVIIEEDGREESLLIIPFTEKDYSWSEFIVHFIGLFTLWCSQKNGFKEINSDEYKLKLNLYKKMAFKTSVGALSLYSCINKRYNQSKITYWKNLGLLNANLIFNNENIKYLNIEEFEEFVPKDARYEAGEVNFEEAVSANLNFLHKNSFNKLNLMVNDYYRHPTDGYSLIGKLTSSPNNTFYKLICIGSEWDEELLDYWNGKLYSPKENKWYSSRKDD